MNSVLSIGWADIENISNLLSASIPFILLTWFLYSQKEILSKQYYVEIGGEYAGFCEPLVESANLKLYAGVIMEVKEVDEKGYFKGNLHFAQKTGIIDPGNWEGFSTSLDSFFGYLTYRPYRNKARHILKPNENRVYKGTLYLVDRLDFDFSNYKIEDYLVAEYEISHYREMGVIHFKLIKSYKSDRPTILKEFTLYKSMGVTFEPYESVVKTVFQEHPFIAPHIQEHYTSKLFS